MAADAGNTAIKCAEIAAKACAAWLVRGNTGCQIYLKLTQRLHVAVWYILGP